MDYERIEKHPTPSGGFSPAKLRAMLLGVEKRKKDEEEELEARFSLRSDIGESEDRRCDLVGADTEERCKDVDIVSLSSRLPALEEELRDAENVLSGFEFQRAERAQHHRSVLMPPFSKPAPSKWDDAQKWIASPTSNRQGKGAAALSKKAGFMGYGGRQQVTKVILEVPEEGGSKKVDLNHGRMEMCRKTEESWVPEPEAAVDWGIKAAPVVEVSVAGPSFSLSHHDTPACTGSETTFVMPATTVKSVSMRDMGTEMTPIASQEPSQNGTPVRATTPTRSPTSSRPSTPRRIAPPTTFESANSNRDKELSERELKSRTRREIMLLGTQLGKMNIAAWASKEEEETDASASSKMVAVDQPPKSVVETRAAVWEEAEKAKYIARFKREEVKIQAWENHQKAKTEAEMRKVEVEVERMRARAHDKLMNKLATAKHKAEEKRAAAEARRNQQAARTAQQVEYIRRTGRIPSSFSCWGWCS